MLAAALESRLAAAGVLTGSVVRKLAASPSALDPFAAHATLKTALQRMQQQSKHRFTPAARVALAEMAHVVATVEAIACAQQEVTAQASGVSPEPQPSERPPDPTPPSFRFHQPVRDSGVATPTPRRQRGIHAGTTQRQPITPGGTKLLRELRRTIHLADELLSPTPVPATPQSPVRSMKAVPAQGTPTGYTSVQQSRLEAAEMITLANRLNDIVRKHVEHTSPATEPKRGRKPHKQQLRRGGVGSSGRQHDQHHSAVGTSSQPVHFLNIPAHLSPQQAAKQVKDSFATVYRSTKHQLPYFGATQPQTAATPAPAISPTTTKHHIEVGQKGQAARATESGYAAAFAGRSRPKRRTLGGWLHTHSTASQA